MAEGRSAAAQNPWAADTWDVLRALTDAFARHVPVRNVASVGNAPLDPSAERAEAIDSCDLVFRVNGFAADGRGRPPAVGRRTDVVVFNRGVRPTPWVFDHYRERLYLMVEPGRLHHEREEIPPWWPADLGAVSMPNREVAILLSRELGIDAEHDGLWATTGTMSAWIARHLYPEAALHLAGYSFLDNAEQDSWRHAFGDGSPVGPEHRIGLEGALMRRWLGDGHATYHP